LDEGCWNRVGWWMDSLIEWWGEGGENWGRDGEDLNDYEHVSQCNVFHGIGEVGVNRSN
jgi:hypothetical protein